MIIHLSEVESVEVEVIDTNVVRLRVTEEANKSSALLLSPVEAGMIAQMLLTEADKSTGES